VQFLAVDGSGVQGKRMDVLPADGTLTVAAALVAGFASGLHCFGMCGPLACAGCAVDGARMRAVVAYQAARTAAYLVLGTLAGAAGAGAMGALSLASPRWLPWALAFLLAASALGLGEWLPRVPGVGALVRAAARAGRGMPAAARSALLGAVTPLLPCGLVYALAAAALASGSGAGGAMLAGGFVLGSAPWLAAAQFQTAWMRRLPRGSEFVLRRAVPLAAAAALAWRAIALPAAGTCAHCMH